MDAVIFWAIVAGAFLCGMGVGCIACAFGHSAAGDYDQPEARELTPYEKHCAGVVGRDIVAMPLTVHVRDTGPVDSRHYTPQELEPLFKVIPGGRP